jgi:ketosteroid isomerase-like protein
MDGRYVPLRPHPDVTRSLRRWTWALLVAALVLAGCDPTPGDVAIERGRDRWVAALNAGEPERLAQPYEATGVLLPPGEGAVVGREAIAEWWRDLMGSHHLRYDFEEAGFDQDGRIGYRYGTYRLEGVDRRTGELIRREDDFLQIWRRQRDGSWRLALDVWYPAAGAPD